MSLRYLSDQKLRASKLYIDVDLYNENNQSTDNRSNYIVAQTSSVIHVYVYIK